VPRYTARHLFVLRPLATAFAICLGPAVGWGATLPEVRVDGTVAPGPLSGEQSGVELAPFDGGYFLLWEDSRTSDVWPDLWATALDPLGAVMGVPTRVAGGPGAQHEKALACGTQVCLAVWAEGLRVYGRRFTLQGVALDAATTPLVFSAPVTSYGTSPAVTFEGTEFRVVWNDTGGLYTRLVGVAGAMGPIVRISPSGVDFPRLVSGPAGTLLTYDDGTPRAVYRRGLPDGGFSAATILGSNLYYHSVSSAAASDGWLVTWLDVSNGRRLASRIDAAGTNLDPGGINLGVNGGPPICAAAVDGGYLLRWSESDQLRGATVSALGALANLPDTPLGNVDTRETSLAMQGDEGLLAFSVGPWGSQAKLALRNVVGDTLGPERPAVLLANNGQTRPAVATGRDGFLVVWEDDRLDAGQDIRAVRVGTTGQPIGAPFNVAAGPQAQRAPFAVFDGSNFLVLWKQLEGQSTIKLQSLAGDGTPVGPVRTVTGALSTIFERPVAALGSAGVVVAWSNYGANGWESMTALVSDGGIEPEVQVIPGATGMQLPSIAFASGLFALVTTSEARSAIELTRLDPRGLALPGGRITIASSVTSAVGNGVASDGQNFFAVWAAKGTKEWSIFGRRFDPAGQMLDAAPLTLFDAVDTITSSFETYPLPSVVFDGTDYVVSFSRLSPTTGGDVVQLHVSPSGAVSPVFVVEGNAEDQTEVVLAAGSPGRVLSAYRTYDAALGVPRVAVRVVAKVPEGKYCASTPECVTGSCIANVCCAGPDCSGTLPDGGTALPDGGTGGGAGGGAGGGTGGGAGGGGGAGPAGGRYLVGCGCNGGSGSALLALLLLFTRRPDRRRTRG
jgi:hypothetical protein